MYREKEAITKRGINDGDYENLRFVVIVTTERRQEKKKLPPVHVLRIHVARATERERERETDREKAMTNALERVHWRQSMRDSAGDRPTCLRKDGIFTPY